MIEKIARLGLVAALLLVFGIPGVASATPLPPTPDAGPDRVGAAGEPLMFMGTANAPGGVQFVEWRFSDGAVIADYVVDHTFAQPGVYEARFVVTDTYGQVAEDLATVTITDHPYAEAGPNHEVEVGQEVTLDGSASIDVVGTIVSYQWTFGDGSPAVVSASPIATHTYATSGNFVATLVVTDNDGNTDFDTAVVFVSESEESLVANAGPDQTLFRNLAGYFSGTGSTHGQSYVWNFGDGNTAELSGWPQTSHAFTQAGTYTVSLTVEAANGATASDSAVVTVVNDQVTAVSAVWSKSKKTLTIQAKSNTNGGATLTATGYGALTYNVSTQVYSRVVSNVASKPASVTVTSSAGGSATVAVSQVK